MATSSLSAALTNQFAGTISRDSILTKGIPAVIQGAIEKVAGNTNNDYIGLVEVHRDWSVSSIMLANDALTGATDNNIGLVSYDPVAGTFTDVDENCYADAIDVEDGVAFTDRAFTTRDISKSGQYVWQDAGYSSRGDCAERLYIAWHFQSATTATGTISWRVHVVLPG